VMEEDLAGELEENRDRERCTMAGMKTGPRKWNWAGGTSRDSAHRSRPRRLRQGGKQILCGCDAQIEAKAQTEAEDSRAGTKTASAALAESEN
jgi:hypothetical protein